MYITVVEMMHGEGHRRLRLLVLHVPKVYKKEVFSRHVFLCNSHCASRITAVRAEKPHVVMHDEMEPIVPAFEEKYTNVLQLPRFSSASLNHYNILYMQPWLSISQA